MFSFRSLFYGRVLDNWAQKAIRRRTTGTGRMRHLKDMPRRAKNGFREGKSNILCRIFSFVTYILLFCRNCCQEECINFSLGYFYHDSDTLLIRILPQMFMTYILFPNLKAGEILSFLS